MLALPSTLSELQLTHSNPLELLALLLDYKGDQRACADRLICELVALTDEGPTLTVEAVHEVPSAPLLGPSPEAYSPPIAESGGLAAPDVYIPVAEAVQKYHLTRQWLTQLAARGDIAKRTQGHRVYYRVRDLEAKVAVSSRVSARSSAVPSKARLSVRAFHTLLAERVAQGTLDARAAADMLWQAFVTA